MAVPLAYAAPLRTPSRRPVNREIVIPLQAHRASQRIASLPKVRVRQTAPRVAQQRGLEVEQVGDVTIVKFIYRNILTTETIHRLGEQLLSLVEHDGHRKLLLNFGQIDRLTSALLGKLLLLHKKLRQAGGRLVLCKIAPHLHEIFTLLKLQRILGIYPKEQEALQGLRTAAI